MTLSWSLGLGSLGRRLSSAWPAFGSSQDMPFNIFLQAWSQKTLPLICTCIHIYNHIFIQYTNRMFFGSTLNHPIFWFLTPQGHPCPKSMPRFRIDIHSLLQSSGYQIKIQAPGESHGFGVGKNIGETTFFLKEPPHLLGKPVYASSLSTLSNRMGHGCKLASAMSWMWACFSHYPYLTFASKPRDLRFHVSLSLDAKSKVVHYGVM